MNDEESLELLKAIEEGNYLRKQINELKLENERLSNELKALKGEEESSYYFTLPYMPDNIYNGKSLAAAITTANDTTQFKGKLFCVVKLLGSTFISSNYVPYS